MTRRVAGVAAAAAAVAAAVVVLAAASCCEARDFYVGGRDGWTTNPAEPYNRWAERNRFQVNDRLGTYADSPEYSGDRSRRRRACSFVCSCRSTLSEFFVKFGAFTVIAVFRYNKEDSVVVVSQGHYDGCNATDPLLRDAGGDSTFVFDSSGPFFFISGDPARCQAGERLIVVVLAVRGNGTATPTTPSPPPPPTVPAAPTPRPSPPPPAAGTNGTARAPSPPVPAPAPAGSPPPPPPPPAGGNFTAPSPAGGMNFTAPAPGTNGTAAPPPRPSSAPSVRGGALLMLLVVATAGAMALV